MLTRTTCFIAIFLLTLTGFSQAPAWSWATRAGGSGNEAAYKSYTDASGNVYTCGAFTSPMLTFGTQIIYNQGGVDFFVTKYDPSGNLLWVFGAGGSGDEEAYSLSGSSQGKLAVCGYFTSDTLPIGSTPLANASPGSADIFLFTLDEDGTASWASAAGSSGHEEAYQVAADPSGNFIISGYFGSPSLTFGTDNLQNAALDYNDVFVAKYDPNGAVLWARGAGGDYSEGAYGVATDAAGNIYITGGFGSTTLTFGSTTALVNNGWANLFLVKYNAAGTALWAKSAGGSWVDEAYKLCVDQNNGVYLAGYFSSASLQFGTTTLTNAASGTNDLFLAKYNQNGIPQWALSAGGSGNEAVYSLACDPGNNLLITGGFTSASLDFPGNSLSNAGDSDAYLAKYNASGQCQWARALGSTGHEEGIGVYSDLLGNVFLAGYFASESVNWGAGQLYNPSPGYNEAFICKYDPAGNFSWARKPLGSGFDEAYANATDPAGNLIMGGYFTSPVIQFGNHSFTNALAGASDIFLVKYDSLGTALWADSAGGTGNETIYDLACDTDGNIYAAGAFTSATISFGNFQLANAGLSDIFVVKYDPAGTVVWAVAFGSDGHEEAYAIDVVPGGGVVLSGYFSSHSLAFGTTTLLNAGTDGSDIFLARLEPTGSPTWAKSFGGSGSETTYSLHVAANNTIRLAGAFNSPSLPIGTQVLTHAGNGDALLACFDLAANPLWASSLGSNGTEEALAVTGDVQNNLLVSGYFSSASLSFGNTNLLNASSGTNDVFLLKFSPSGSPLWAKNIGENGNESANSLTCTGSTVFLAGGFDSPNLNISGQNLVNQGEGDIFLCCFDSLGTLVYAFGAGGTGTEIPFHLATDANGNLYLAGSFSSENLSVGSNTLNTAGSLDVLLLNLHHGIALGLDPTLPPISIKAFPNPSDGEFTLLLPSDRLDIDVYNASGKLVKSLVHEAGGQTLRLSLRQPGAYFLVIRSKTTTSIQPLLVY